MNPISLKKEPQAVKPYRQTLRRTAKLVCALNGSGTHPPDALSAIRQPYEVTHTLTKKIITAQI